MHERTDTDTHEDTDDKICAKMLFMLCYVMVGQAFLWVFSQNLCLWVLTDCPLTFEQIFTVHETNACYYYRIFKNMTHVGQ